MSWLNIAYAFLFVSNLAFMVGAGLVLMRILHASSQTRAELLKAAGLSMEAGKQLKLAARRAVTELEKIGDAHVARESSSGRAVQQLSFQIKNLIDQVGRTAALNRPAPAAAATPQAMSEQEEEDIRAKLQAELNAVLAKNHLLQEQIEQTQFRLKDVSVANTELREELGDNKEIKQSVVDNLLAHATELEARLQKARERAKAAEKQAEENAFQLDELRAQINAQKFSRPAPAPVNDQSDLVRDQQDQIDVLASREKALLAKIEQLEMEFKRQTEEKVFIEDRFLQLDSARTGSVPL